MSHIPGDVLQAARTMIEKRTGAVKTDGDEHWVEWPKGTTHHERGDENRFPSETAALLDGLMDIIDYGIEKP